MTPAVSTMMPPTMSVADDARCAADALADAGEDAGDHEHEHRHEDEHDHRGVLVEAEHHPREAEDHEPERRAGRGPGTRTAASGSLRSAWLYSASSEARSDQDCTIHSTTAATSTMAPAQHHPAVEDQAEHQQHGAERAEDREQAGRHERAPADRAGALGQAVGVGRGGHVAVAEGQRRRRRGTGRPRRRWPARPCRGSSLSLAERVGERRDEPVDADPDQELGTGGDHRASTRACR